MHKFLLFSDIHVVRPHHPRRRQFRPVSPAASAAFAGPATLVAPAVRPALAGSPVRALLLWRAWSHHVVFSPVWNYAAESRRQKLNGECNDKYRPHPRFRSQPNIQDHEQHIDRTYRQVDDEQDVMMLFRFPAKGQKEEFLPEGKLPPFVYLAHHRRPAIARNIFLQNVSDYTIRAKHEPQWIKNAHKQSSQRVFYNRIHPCISQILRPCLSRNTCRRRLK